MMIKYNIWPDKFILINVYINQAYILHILLSCLFYKNQLSTKSNSTNIVIIVPNILS